MPLAEAREWERLAVLGPGPYQTSLLLGQLVMLVARGLGVEKPPALHEICPWVDLLEGDPEAERERRDREADDRELESMLAFSAAQGRKESADGG